MRNIPLHTVDATPRDVLAIATDYPAGTLLPMHQHRRAQLLYGISGLMEVETNDGAWVIPPYNAVWIPAEKPHQVRMQGVSTRSLYIEATRELRPSHACEVLMITPLLHQLLLASADVPPLYNEQGHEGALMQLILFEVQTAQTRNLFAPIPKDSWLADQCRTFLAAPSIKIGPEHWAMEKHTSVRHFTRLFKQQTGLTFQEWRQQACLMAAVTQLAAGQSVTHIALELGYETPNSFSAMFKNKMGLSPFSFQKRLHHNH